MIRCLHAFKIAGGPKIAVRVALRYAFERCKHMNRGLKLKVLAGAAAVLVAFSPMANARGGAGHGGGGGWHPGGAGDWHHGWGDHFNRWPGGTFFGYRGVNWFWYTLEEILVWNGSQYIVVTVIGIGPDGDPCYADQFGNPVCF